MRSSSSLLLAALVAMATPAPVHAGLLVEPLRPPLPGSPRAAGAADLSTDPARALLALAADPPAGDGKQKEGKKKAKPPPAPGDLDFDLLGAEVAPQGPDPAQMKLRRQLLTFHQGVGIALYSLEVTTVVLGQLNYRDKFSTHMNTEKWRIPHKSFAYATTAAMVLNGALALAAPNPTKKPFRLDRVGVHKIAMFTAFAGIATEVGLGLYTHSREGYMDQQHLAKVHLAIGYATLAAMTVGVAALVL